MLIVCMGPGIPRRYRPTDVFRAVSCEDGIHATGERVTSRKGTARTDGQRFDDLTRSLAALGGGPASRRRVLRGLVGGLVAALGGQAAARADHQSSHCARAGEKPKPHKACCAGLEVGADGRCEGECENAADPCGGTCCTDDQYCDPESVSCVACMKAGGSCGADFQCCSGSCNPYINQCA